MKKELPYSGVTLDSEKAHLDDVLKQATIEEPLIYDLVGSKGGSATLFVA